MSPYEQGFIDKCAEFSIDPVALLKAAGIAENRAAMLQAYQDQFGKNAPERIEGYLAPDGSWGFDRSTRAPGSRTYTVIGGARPPMHPKPTSSATPPASAVPAPGLSKREQPIQAAYKRYANMPGSGTPQMPAPIPPAPSVVQTPDTVPQPATVDQPPTPYPTVS